MNIFIFLLLWWLPQNFLALYATLNLHLFPFEALKEIRNFVPIYETFHPQQFKEKGLSSEVV